MLIKILVIEDQNNNMRLIEQILEDVGENIMITKADSGEKAILVGKDEEFDLVLTDIALPNMDGIQTAQMLKTYPQYRSTPFIAVTAYAALKDEEVFRQVFNDYISKPINDDLFIEKVKKWIGDKL
jgi:CheY-like chemotaxis protein